MINYNVVIGKYAFVDYRGVRNFYKIEGHAKNHNGEVNLVLNSPHSLEDNRDKPRRIHFHSCYIHFIQRFPNSYYTSNGYKRSNILRMLKSKDLDTYNLAKEVVKNLNFQYKKENK